MSKATLEETEKKYAHAYQDEYNDEDFNENYDVESEKNKIVECSPKGRFIRFNEELGSGAYKTVYKAYDNETGWEVAWNVIKLQRLPDKERKRISDEIALLKQLKHPNIIHFINAWINRQKEEVIFITEAVTGGSLKRFLKKIKVPRLKVIKTWCREILQGIEYLHSSEPHPIIHRDIKCDNIFINSNKGEIRIGDLGLATFMSHAYADSVLGTPEFMAPEMYEEVYGPSVDIYSFGMCVLEMVTNQTPYRECMNPAQIYRKVSKGIKPSCLTLIANEEVKNFITDCLKPKDERPTATELLKHRFLANLDPELDNQPVLLYESPPMTKIDEEESVKDSIRMSERGAQALYQGLEGESGTERENQSQNSTFTEERKEEGINGYNNGEGYELRKKAVSEKVTVEQVGEKLLSASQFKLMAKQKSQEHIIDTTTTTQVNNNNNNAQIPLKKSDEPSQNTEQVTKLDAKTPKAQDAAQEKSFDQQDQKSQEKKKQGSPKEVQAQAQEGEKPKQETTAEKIATDKQLKKGQEGVKTVVEEIKQGEPKKSSIQEQNPLLSVKEGNTGKYHFYSKGIINNYLTICVKNEAQQFESVIEIPKEKIYAEKIKSKLLKLLDLVNPNDAYFNQQLNILYDTLIAQNILQGPITTNLLIHSYSQKSLTTTEHQKSPDKSLLTTNPNSVYFLPTYFHKFYQKYLTKIPREYLMIESEEAMVLRHQREIMELENFHLAQKRSMWDRRQNIMSNSLTATNQTGAQTNIIDPDDFYHKVFQFNDMSSKSENKKKGSRCADLSLSSVDSITLSPTCSSGNNIHSISNWTDGNPISSKKEEVLTNMIDEVTKIPVVQTSDPVVNEHNNDNKAGPDTTPKGQTNGTTTSQPINMSSPRANTASVTTAKYPTSNFANNAIKSTQAQAQVSVKAQSDKSGNKEKKRPESQEKEAETQQLPVKRPSIEKNLENGQQLLQSLHQAQDHQQVADVEKGGESRKEMIKYDKLTINTNLSSSPPEKGSNKNAQIPHEGIPKSQPKTPNANTNNQTQQQGQGQGVSQSQRQHPHPHLQISSTNQIGSIPAILTPTNSHNNPLQINTSLPSSCRSNTSTVSQPNFTFSQGFTSQPNSATLKNPQPLSMQPFNPNIVENTNKPSQNQQVATNSMAQKMSLVSHNSAGTLQGNNQGKGSTNGPSSSKSVKPGLITNSTSSLMKPNEISQSSYVKLQSLELVEKIKNYKIKRPLKRHDMNADTEDVKMLQTCLELLTESEILSNGHFNHYTENLIKTCQQKMGVPADGVVDESVWEKMQNALEKKIEKRKLAKEAIKNKEAMIAEPNHANNAVDDIKKKMKDKQNKEASECLTKIESNLINLSDLKIIGK